MYVLLISKFCVFFIFWIDILVFYVECNLSNGDVIMISFFIGIIVMLVKVFDGKICKYVNLILKGINLWIRNCIYVIWILDI